VRRVLRENGLAIVVFGLFLTFLAIESVVGQRANNHEREDHGQPPESYLEFVTSGDFLESTAENWESEFLEMAAYVVLTSFLFQKGSAESKKLHTPEKVDRDPRRAAHKPNVPWPVRHGGWVLRVYECSLSLAFVLLFLFSFLMHALGGVHAYNEAQLAHGQSPVTLGEFMRSSQFWFQSMQNWQSEFLGLGSMIVLTIVLRQRGSPESKPVDAAHSETGGG
jgi:hypothetical protein